jgi:two-component system phosphate regulon sensor histidine kinase PhoR
VEARRILPPVLALSVAVVLLAGACAALGLLLARARRERREVLGLVGGEDGPLPDAVRRELHRRVPRDELSATLFSREAILDAAPTPVLVFDAAGRVVRVNPAAREALPAAEPGTSAGAIAPGLGEALAGVLAGPPVGRREIALDAPDRRKFEAHLRSHPDGDGRSAVAVLVDVTAPVDYREARRLFSASVSHELRTPLARILGLAETLGLPLSPDERDALVAQTEVEIDNMRRLIDEMLMLAALDRGEAALAEGYADAGETAASVVHDRLERSTGRGRDITLEVVPGLLVPVAPRLLHVVLGNLVDNGLRHGGAEAAICVSVRGLAGEVEITVADTGVGIPSEHLPHVFERFYRGEASRAGPGTGLGLAVVKHIVEAHGGRVSAQSHPGRGTTVRLTLPEAVTTDS